MYLPVNIYAHKHIYTHILTEAKKADDDGLLSQPCLKMFVVSLFGLSHICTYIYISHICTFVYICAYMTMYRYR